MTDLAVCLAAGRALNPWIDNAVAFVWWIAPGVAFIAVLYAASRPLAAIGRRIQAHRNRVVLPPAPDNRAGTDTELLEHCQRIDAEPIADPSQIRRFINYLRDTGEEK